MGLYKRSHLWKKCARRILLELQKIRLKVKYSGSAPTPYSLIYLNVEDIKYYRYMYYVVKEKLVHGIDPRYGTFIIGGNWDRGPSQDEYEDSHHREDIEDYYLWKSTVDRFSKNLRWEETSGFNERNHGVSWFQKVEKLYYNIQSDGYKSQREMEDGYDDYFMPPEYDEIRVNIGRDGEIFLDDGRHRFCAVKMLDIEEKIPARVYVRHKKWQELRDYIYNNGLSKEHEDLRDHPDLQDVLD